MNVRVNREDIKFYKPTELERNIIASSLFKMKEHRLFYKSISKGKYKVYCSNCQRYEEIDSRTLKQIRASHVCPFCYHEIKTSKKEEVVIYEYVEMEQTYGYEIKVTWKFGGIPKVTSLRQLMYFTDVDFEDTHYNGGYYQHYKCNGYAKQVGINMAGTLSYFFDRPWTPITSCRYLDNCYSYNWLVTISPLQFGETTKKEALEKLLKGIELKDNQKYIVIHNLLSYKQILLLRAFDLKSYEEVIKYSKQFFENYVDGYSYKKHSLDSCISSLKEMKPLNKFFLEYLIANNIDLRDYYDYMKQLDKLGYKYDKPKDFAVAHGKASRLINVMENKEKYDKKISKRFKSLPSYSKVKDKKEYKITPFKNSEEIMICADMLNNCIATYISRYADKQTDLYHLDVDGKLKVAIEIKSNQLLQAKIVNNGHCPTELFNHVKSFCKANKIGTRSSSNYAY